MSRPSWAGVRSVTDSTAGLGEGLDLGGQIGRGRHRRDLVGHPSGGLTVCRAGEQRLQRLLEVLRAASCRSEDDAAAGVVDGDTVLPLVGEQRHDQLRPAV